jgi:type IV pilus assembly protein PilM
MAALLKDPPPPFAFELSEAGVAVARTTRPPQIGFYPLEPEVISVSPVRDNVLRLDALAQRVRDAAGVGKDGRRRPHAAVILPDCSVRISVLDFDAFPADPGEQLSLVRFRIRKTLPFDVDSASLSYFPQPAGPGHGRQRDVVVAVAPLEIVARYEAPFRASGFHPGVVTTSTLAALPMVPGGGLAVLVKLSGRMLTISVLQHDALKLLRSIELIEVEPAEVLQHLYPTFAYAEDQLSASPDRVLVSGFGPETEAVALRFEAELGVPVERLRSRFGIPEQGNTGLLGYLESLEDAG